MVNVTTPLLIIGAALPRTATTSLAAALETLGYRVWHATTFSPSMTPIWNDLSQAEEEKGNTSEAYRAAFDQFVEQLSAEGFNATLDQPSCFVYQELMEYYPDAKVLKTERNAASWARSMVEMVYSLDLLVYQPPYNHSWNKVQGPFGYWGKKKLGLTEIYPLGVPFNGTNDLETKSSVSLASCEAAYHRYQQQVEQIVPPEKLVSYSVKEGWEPLCRHFLSPEEYNDKCPSRLQDDEQDFPRVNSRNDGFLLDFRRTAAAKVYLYRIHPALANQEWLIRSIVFTMKRRRALLNFLQTKVSWRRR
jgi:hypothetical protein